MSCANTGSLHVCLQAFCTPPGTMSRPSSTHTSWCQTQASDARWRQRHGRRWSGLGGTLLSAECVTCSTSEPSVSTRLTKGEHSTIAIAFNFTVQKRKAKKGRKRKQNKRRGGGWGEKRKRGGRRKKGKRKETGYTFWLHLSEKRCVALSCLGI